MHGKEMRPDLGAEGEEVAAGLLRDKGFEILRRNFRSGHNEIDIICRDGNDVRFVEVKSRREPVEGEPWEAVTLSKQKRIASAARAFLATKRDFPLGECHFDVITLVWRKDNTDYVSEYIPDAYIPIYF